MTECLTLFQKLLVQLHYLSDPHIPLTILTGAGNLGPTHLNDLLKSCKHGNNTKYNIPIFFFFFPGIKNNVNEHSSNIRKYRVPTSLAEDSYQPVISHLDLIQQLYCLKPERGC